MTEHAVLAARFQDQGHVDVPGFLEDPLLFTLYRYVLRKALTGRMQLDPHIDGALREYGDLLMETVLELATPTVARITGRELAPTYSYVRVYTRGNVLARHRDRESCEFTLTVCLGADPGDADPGYRWPLFMQPRPEGPPLEFTGGPGHALLFRGQDLEHWREPFAGEHQVQLFLHYVDIHGPHASHENDRRPALYQAIADSP